MKTNYRKLQFILIALAALCLVGAVRAQTLTFTNISSVTNITVYAADTNNTPTLQNGIDTLYAAFSQSVSNSYWVAYGIRAKGLPKEYGFGIGWFNPINNYFTTGVRVDYVDGAFWMPSGSATLQYPINLGSYLTVTPFTFAGIGVPLSGAKIQLGTLGGVTIPGTATDNNGKATAITGLGAAVKIYAGTDWNISAVYDAENWTGFNGTQQRLGIAYQSHKPGLFGIGLNLGVIKL